MGTSDVSWAGERQSGHSAFSPHHCAMQCQQKTWPHGVDAGLVRTWQQYDSSSAYMRYVGRRPAVHQQYISNTSAGDQQYTSSTSAIHQQETSSTSAVHSNTSAGDRQYITMQCQQTTRPHDVDLHGSCAPATIRQLHISRVGKHSTVKGTVLPGTVHGTAR